MRQKPEKLEQPGALATRQVFCYLEPAMKLTINGEEKAFENVTTLSALIDQLGLKGDRVAVELNRDIVPRSNWNSTVLHDGDKLEIVHFVGGG